MTHYSGHQQALIKNNICVAVLSFPEHEEIENNIAFEKIDHDTVINMCEHIDLIPFLDGSWNGETFNRKSDFESWSIGEDLKWHAPIPEPEPIGSHYWDEDQLNWFEIPTSEEPK
jgi:hypothetical protein